MKTFKTPKGTELPILDIKGKDYLQAAPRILWMREEHPDWSIETELLNFTEKQAVFKATIRDGAGKILAQATSMETQTGFDSFLEKAETCAISRAAAFCGYGTLMAQELEEREKEGNRMKLAESPNEPKGSHLKAVSDPGSYIIQMGKKFKGFRLDACDAYELSDFSKWLSEQSDLKGIGLETRDKIEVYLATKTNPRSK